MSKYSLAPVLAALLISSSLQAHIVAPDEIKQFSAQILHVDFDAAPDDVKQKITTEYEKRIKLAEVLTVKLKSDPEYIRLSETLALDLWSKRIAEATKPTDEEIQKAYENAKDLNVAPSYKLRHIAVAKETAADDILKQLNAKSGDERNQLFASLASAQSLDQNSKQRGGSIGWVDSAALPPVISSSLKDKESGSLTKLAIGQDMWDVILIDEIKPQHPATLDEAKGYLSNMIRQQTVENEANKILESSDTKTTNASKNTKKMQRK
ncbi:MAG: peptidyl-prolyl cis-trans isomerase [Sulfuricurvum sp.]|nr:peptidyl-prolyl cis-trans isomerase [Sulfuricurvum sp.]